MKKKVTIITIIGAVVLGIVGIVLFFLAEGDISFDGVSLDDVSSGDGLDVDSSSGDYFDGENEALNSQSTGNTKRTPRFRGLVESILPDSWRTNKKNENEFEEIQEEILL